MDWMSAWLKRGENEKAVKPPTSSVCHPPLLSEDVGIYLFVQAVSRGTHVCNKEKQIFFSQLESRRSTREKEEDEAEAEAAEEEEEEEEEKEEEEEEEYDDDEEEEEGGRKKKNKKNKDKTKKKKKEKEKEKERGRKKKNASQSRIAIKYLRPTCEWSTSDLVGEFNSAYASFELARKMHCECMRWGDGLNFKTLTLSERPQCRNTYPMQVSWRGRWQLHSAVSTLNISSSEFVCDQVHQMITSAHEYSLPEVETSAFKTLTLSAGFNARNRPSEDAVPGSKARSRRLHWSRFSSQTLLRSAFEAFGHLSAQHETPVLRKNERRCVS
ncbi:hypothetical protein Efla_005605 [Eimeria flavescens]